MKRIAVFAVCLAFILALGISVARAAEESVNLTVFVIALGNAPVENATVTVGDRSDTTKHNGGCVFSLPPGDYTICAKGSWGGMSGEKCQDVNLKGSARFVVLELFQKVESVWK